MAEAVVGVLISKLSLVLAREAASFGASLLCKEASALKGLFGEIRKANGELELMKAYLHDLEKFNGSNEITTIFVKKIRDLAFRIEDVVDEFTYKLEDEKHGKFATKTKKKIKHLKVWHRLAAELRDINAEIEDATKKRDRYAMPGIEWGTNGSHDHATSSSNQTSCFAREEDLVGIEGNATKLTGWLLADLEENNSKIATVWGMGGAGKTTLVGHVYKTVKVDFEIAAWVSVSKSYQVHDLLKKIAREFGIKLDASNMEMRYLVQVIHDYLKGKRYILILDDVWEMDVWINLMDVFPTNSIGRFVLTSRKYEIASLATSDHVIKLEPFDGYHSWKLFCNIAFRNNQDKKCPLELQELVAKFLDKSEGLPIAIACLGRLLCCKPLTYSAWKSVYEELQLKSSKKMIPGIDTILKVSLDDLSYELKNCFLHCAFFPEDYEIKRKRLIWHWITAGFIKEEENKTLERVAEGYLNELINRSLLQVVKKKVFGQVKCCRMHDIIRHLALEKAEKECFGRVYNGTAGMFNIGGTRRLSIQSNNISLLSRSGSRHLRAIYSFTRFVGIDILRPILASSKLLSTLDLQGTPMKILPSEIFTLLNLRYLGLRDTGIETLPKAIGRLQNLEGLDALGTGLLYLPKDLEKLRKLKFLYARRQLKNQITFTRYGGIEVPRGIRKLTRLQALQHVTASIETLCDVAALTELRKFSIIGVTSELSAKLCCAIMNMRELVSLSITASNENEALPLEELHLPKTLYKLELKGKLEKKRMPQILSSWPHLNNLSRLNLRFSKLDEDSFSSLMVLHGLCFLKVDKAYSGKKLYFSAQSFPKLRRLDIWGAPHLNHVKIEDGALGSLVELEFSYCPELKSLPYGIEFLLFLEELSLKDTAEQLIEKLRQESEANECSEELMKIKHIRKVVIKLSAKNIWQRIR